MPHSTDLFDLVKSLKQTEKRHFKVYATKHNSNKKNQYIKLFDALDDMTMYDEEAIKEKFKHEKFVNQLHVYKNYLEKIILKSLAAYHANDSVNAQILELLRYVEVLYDKGLIQLCMKKLQKAEKLCRQHQIEVHLIQVLNWQIKIFTKHSQIANVLATIHDANAQINELTKYFQYKEQAYRIYDRVVRIGNILTEQDVKDVEDLINDPLLTQVESSQDPDILYYKYSCFSLYASIIGDVNNHYHYNSLIVTTLENNPHRIEENPYLYVSALNNLSNAQIGLGKWNELYDNIQKLRNIASHFRIKNKVKVLNEALPLSYDIEIIYALKTGKTEELPQIVKFMQDHVSKNANTIKKSNFMDICFNVANAHFVLGEYERSLDWLNQLLNAQQLDIREDIYRVSKVLNLIIHYELGNETLLQNIIKSTYRFLTKQEKLHRIEEEFLHFLKKQHRAKSDQEFTFLLQDLRNKIEYYKDDPFEANILRYFDFISWIDSKLTDKSMAEVIKERAVKH